MHCSFDFVWYTIHLDILILSVKNRGVCVCVWGGGGGGAGLLYGQDLLNVMKVIC